MLSVLCGVSSVWTALLLLTGGFSVQIGPLRVSSQTPYAPLVIALVSGLSAWAVALVARDASPARPRPMRRVLLLTLLIAGLNVLFLTAPPPPQNVNNCIFVREVGIGLRHVLNCDAVEFLFLSQSPSQVLTVEHPYRQSRPLSFVLPYLVSRPLTLIPGLVTTDRMPRTEPSSWGMPWSTSRCCCRRCSCSCDC